VVKDSGGFLALPMALALVGLAGAGFGIWGFLRAWRHLAETQLRLDACVGRQAHEFRRELDTLESSNIRMTVLRAAVADALVANPAAVPALNVALQAEVSYQTAVQVRWTAAEARWLARRGCGENGDFPIPLPSFPYLRDPPDPLGPRPLRWTASAEKRLEVGAAHRPRYASAKIESGGESAKWKASWSVPLRIGKWPGFR
jgi:hypothetical protein